MIHEQIQLAIKDVRNLEEELRDVKRDVRKEEKIEDEHYLELKASLKNLRGQVKGFEEDYLADMKKSDFYGELRKAQQKAEEDLAKAREKLFGLLGKVPMKAFEMDLKGEEGFTKIQAMPEMKIFVNGKELKKKSV